MTQTRRHVRFASIRRRRRVRSGLGLCIALALAACATTQPAPAPPPEALPAPPPAPPPPPPRPVARATWEFIAQPQACVAVAHAGRLRLTVDARDSQPIRLILAPVPPLPHERLQLRFDGPAGAWVLAATETRGHAAVASFGPGETGLSRMLLMLSGGTVTPGPAESGLPLLVLPPTGAQGTHWFGCVRHIRS